MGSEPQSVIDANNLRLYARLFREYKWESETFHWSVFEVTLNEVADRISELEAKLRDVEQERACLAQATSEVIEDQRQCIASHASATQVYKEKLDKALADGEALLQRAEKAENAVSVWEWACRSKDKQLLQQVELDVLIATKLCGWSVSTDPRLKGPGWFTDGVEHTCELPQYATDLNACREAEMEIELRGLYESYAIEVQNLIMTRTGPVKWLILTADAETRCKAMLAVLDKHAATCKDSLQVSPEADR